MDACDPTPFGPDTEVVVVRVVDPAGRPIPAATLHHLEERMVHRVNPRDGRWRGEGLGLDAGVRRVAPGEELERSVRAPGSVPVTVRYRIDERQNHVEGALSPLGGAVQDRHDAVTVGRTGTRSPKGWPGPARSRARSSRRRSSTPSPPTARTRRVTWRSG